MQSRDTELQPGFHIVFRSDARFVYLEFHHDVDKAARHYKLAREQALEVAEFVDQRGELPDGFPHVDRGVGAASCLLAS